MNSQKYMTGNRSIFLMRNSSFGESFWCLWVIFSPQFSLSLLHTYKLKKTISTLWVEKTQYQIHLYFHFGGQVIFTLLSVLCMASTYSYLTSMNSVTDKLILYLWRWKELFFFFFNINLKYRDHLGFFVTRNT